MRVIISAGGTGGHIYPALSIIKKIKEHDKNSEFLYIGTLDRMEHEIVPKEKIPYLGIEMVGLSKNPKKCYKSLKLLIKANQKLKKEITNFKPDIVIGVGGYVTFPVIYTAKKLGYKTLIHEQNSIPGKSNKILSRYADIVAVSLPGSLKYFKENAVLTGNPRSSEAILAPKALKSEFNLKHKKLVLIVMGSLGSMSINQELKKIIVGLKDKDYDCLIVTGKNYYDEFKDFNYENIKIVPFLNNMLNVLKICDLIITRAGASVIAEICAIGLPSILVPSPYVANNHQYYNAMELVSNKASLLLEEKDFNLANLEKAIAKVLDDKKLCQEMQENALALAQIDASEKIYQLIKELVGNDYGKSNK